MLHVRTLARPWRNSTPDRLTEQVERLAHHALPGRGVGQGRHLLPARPAPRRSTRSALREAAAAFEQALAALEHLPDSRAHLRAGD